MTTNSGGVEKAIEQLTLRAKSDAPSVYTTDGTLGKADTVEIEAKADDEPIIAVAPLSTEQLIGHTVMELPNGTRLSRAIGAITGITKKFIPRPWSNEHS